MSTISKHIHDRSGPLMVKVKTTDASIEVIADRKHNVAYVTVVTDADDGPSAKAVQRTTYSKDRTGALVVDVPDEMPSGSVIGRGSIVIGGNVTGSVINTGGRGKIIVNGVDVTDTVNSAKAAIKPIVVTVRVPLNSDVILNTVAGAITVTGAMASVDAGTTSGRISTTATHRANLTSVSGGLEITEAADVQAQTTSGPITIGRADTVNAVSVSGRINVALITGTGQGALGSKLGTTSGAITASYLHTEPRVRTISGRTRIHQHTS